jgi:hypothetical protein
VALNTTTLNTISTSKISPSLCKHDLKSRCLDRTKLEEPIFIFYSSLFLSEVTCKLYMCRICVNDYLILKYQWQRQSSSIKSKYMQILYVQVWEIYMNKSFAILFVLSASIFGSHYNGCYSTHTELEKM